MINLPNVHAFILCIRSSIKHLRRLFILNPFKDGKISFDLWNYYVYSLSTKEITISERRFLSR